MSNKKFRPTSYVVIFWNEDCTEKIKEEVYPMYLYSFDNVVALLKGNETTCDIYEGRYWADRGKYITTGNVYVWDGYKWVLHM